MPRAGRRRQRRPDAGGAADDGRCVVHRPRVRRTEGLEDGRGVDVSVDDVDRGPARRGPLDDAAKRVRARPRRVGEREAGDTRDERGGHRRSRPDLVRAVAEIHDGVAGRGDRDPGAVVREVGQGIVGVRGGDADDARVRGGVEAAGRRAVSGGGDDEDAVLLGVGDGIGERRLGGRSAEGEVDHVGAVIRRPHDSLGDPGVVARAVRREHLDGQDAALADAGHARAVVGDGCGLRGNRRAVTVVVRRVGVVIDEVVTGEELRVQVLHDLVLRNEE